MALSRQSFIAENLEEEGILYLPVWSDSSSFFYFRIQLKYSFISFLLNGGKETEQPLGSWTPTYAKSSVVPRAAFSSWWPDKASH